MNIRKIRKEINFRREEILEDYYLFYITKEEFEILMNELDDYEEEINELEYSRKKLKRERRKIISQNIINKIKGIK